MPENGTSDDSMESTPDRAVDRAPHSMSQPQSPPTSYLPSIPAPHSPHPELFRAHSQDSNKLQLKGEPLGGSQQRHPTAVPVSEGGLVSSQETKYTIHPDAFHSPQRPVFAAPAPHAELVRSGTRDPARGLSEDILNACNLLLCKKTHCSEREVREGFNKKALVSHPDKGGSNEAFLQLKQCRDMVLTKNSRAKKIQSVFRGYSVRSQDDRAFQLKCQKKNETDCRQDLECNWINNKCMSVEKGSSLGKREESEESEVLVNKKATSTPDFFTIGDCDMLHNRTECETRQDCSWSNNECMTVPKGTPIIKMNEGEDTGTATRKKKVTSPRKKVYPSATTPILTTAMATAIGVQGALPVKHRDLIPAGTQNQLYARMNPSNSRSIFRGHSAQLMQGESIKQPDANAFESDLMSDENYVPDYKKTDFYQKYKGESFYKQQEPSLYELSKRLVGALTKPQGTRRQSNRRGSIAVESQGT
jgi:hypothetical protein